MLCTFRRPCNTRGKEKRRVEKPSTCKIYNATLTVVHDRYSSLVIDKSREREDTNFSGKFCIVRLNELYAVLVSVVVNSLQFHKNLATGVTLLVIVIYDKL